jgi:hypothetical protein
MANRALHMLYRCADVAVFPSLYEPFGIVALEAMAAGSPVVASDAGGLREVVLNDETGTLCYANDPASLAWAMLRVLRDPARAAKLNDAARVRLKTDFDWGHIADKTVAVYDQCWSEFLDSYWASDTLWPVSPGADERAEASHVRSKAETGTGTAIERPSVPIETKPDEFLLEEEEATGVQYAL